MSAMPPGRQMYWILRGHQPVPAKDVLEWGEFFEDMTKRRVAEDTIEQPGSDPVRVSTVFLGIDHNWSDNGLPLLFESMVFGGPLNELMVRYSTWNEAIAGHAVLLDEAVLEGKVSAWEVRERLKALAHREEK
jgi:hypothetical protein